MTTLPYLTVRPARDTWLRRHSVLFIILASGLLWWAIIEGLT